VVSASANIAAGNATVQGRAYVTGNAPAGAPIEARVEVLESNLRRVNERLDQTQRELDEEFRKVNASLKQEEAIRLSEDDLTRRKLEASETGGIHITAMGALWLFVGVTLSTASTEISKWLR
jgi:hypothetical protein